LIEFPVKGVDFPIRSCDQFYVVVPTASCPLSTLGSFFGNVATGSEVKDTGLRVSTVKC